MIDQDTFATTPFEDENHEQNYFYKFPFHVIKEIFGKNYLMVKYFKRKSITLNGCTYP